jgi:hypothetical protein
VEPAPQSGQSSIPVNRRAMPLTKLTATATANSRIAMTDIAAEVGECRDMAKTGKR